MRNLRILHISDLHERASFDRMPAAREAMLEWDARQRGLVLGERFFEALEGVKKIGGIDLVCFTGDLADWGQTTEYAKATERMDGILNAVGVPRERFYAIPGNHNVQRNLDVDAWRGIRKWLTETHDVARLGRWLAGVNAAPPGMKPEWLDGVLSRTVSFWRWFESYRRGTLSGRKSVRLGYRETLPVNTFDDVEVPIHIVGLDSAWLCGADESHDGMVLSDQGSIVITEYQVEAHIRRGEQGLDGYRIGLVHHPLDHLADHIPVRRLLGDDGIDILLHGHQHTPLSLLANEPGSPLRILAAGCLIEGELGRDWPNGFQLVELDLTSRAGAVHFRKWSQTGRFWARGSDIYREAPDGVLAWREGTEPSAASPRAGPASPESVLRLLQDFTARDLVSYILSGRISADCLDIIARDKVLVQQALNSVLTALKHDSDTWLRLLYVDLCARSRDAALGVIDTAYDDSLHWGTRTGVLPALRFVPERRRNEVADQLRTHAKTQNPDDQRIAIEGLGFLGELSALRWITEQERVGESKYISEKLGSYVVLGCLDCYSHYENESALSAMRNTLLALHAMDLGNIHPFDYHRRLQLVRPGLSQSLIRHAIQLKDESFTSGLLYALNGRCAPFAAHDLIALAETCPANKDNAHRVLASIGDRNSLDILDHESGGEKNDPRWAFLLAIGWSRSVEHSDVVARALTSAADSGTAVEEALWAAGQLAPNVPHLFVPYLRRATMLANAPTERALGWLGLAKAGEAISQTDLRKACDNATYFVERLILGIAAVHAGQPALLEGAIHVTQAKHGPVWKLWGHLYADFRAACDAKLGAPGKLLLQLLDRGDLD